MAGLEVIRAGRIKKLIVNNIEYAVPTGASCTLRCTVGGMVKVSNEITNTTIGYVIKSEEQQAGFEGLKIHVPVEKLNNLIRVQNEALDVPVILITANGDEYSSENLTITESVDLSSEDNSVTLSMQGKFFEARARA